VSVRDWRDHPLGEVHPVHGFLRDSSRNISLPAYLSAATKQLTVLSVYIDKRIWLSQLYGTLLKLAMGLESISVQNLHNKDQCEKA